MLELDKDCKAAVVIMFMDIKKNKLVIKKKINLKRKMKTENTKWKF